MGRFWWNGPTTIATTAKGVISSLDDRWQVDSRGYSQALSYQVVRLSGLVPFAQVQQILMEVGQIETTSIWEQMQIHGERLHQLVTDEQAHVNVERTRWL